MAEVDNAAKLKVKNQEECRRIVEASARLIEQAEKGNGELPSVSELARQAGVKRWVLVQKHIDLKDSFQSEVTRLEKLRLSQAGNVKLSRSEVAERDNARLKIENAELRKLVRFYAQLVNEVYIEYEDQKARAGSQVQGNNLRVISRES